MRLLRLLDDDLALEFHPYVSVVGGLDEAARDRVSWAVAALPRGKVGTMGGLIESHGVVLDLDEENLALLEMHDSTIDCVVRAGGELALPAAGKVPAVDAPDGRGAELAEAVAAAEASVARQRDLVETAEAGVREAARALGTLDEAVTEPDESGAGDVGSKESEAAAAVALLAETEAALERAQARLADLEGVAAELRAERNAVSTEASALAGQLESAESGLDPQAAADFEAAEQRLREVREGIEQERRAEQAGETAPAPSEPLEHRLARLEVRRIELDARIAILGGAETLAVDTALQELRAGDDGEVPMVLSPEALELADAIERTEAKLAAQGRGFTGNDGTVLAARARLDAARQALAEAEVRVRRPQLDRDDIDALELTHAEVLDAQEKAEGRFSKARSERRLAEAKAAEAAVLARLGFDSYYEYMMGTSMLHVDDEQEEALDRARTELAEAEDAWALLQDGVDSSLEIQAIKENSQALYERAAVLLGGDPGDHVVPRLRTLRVRASRVGDAHGRLASALQSVGLAVAHEDLEHEDLVQLAEEWLAEEQAANEQHEAALAERSEVDLDLAETRSELSQAAAGMIGATDEARRKARVDDATAACEAARERVRRHEATREEVGDFRAALAAVTERVEEFDRRLAEAREAVERAATEVADCESTRDKTAAAHAEVVAALNAMEAPAAHTEGALAGDAREAAMAARRAADDRLSAAREALALAEARAAELRDELDAHDERVAAAGAPAQADVPSPPAEQSESQTAEEVEWALLSRLAAQRRVSFAGSVPMLIDRALDDLTPEEIRVVFDRLERMAAAVQLIVISDAPAAREWAERAGEQRGAVVTPMKPADVVPFG